MTDLRQAIKIANRQKPSANRYFEQENVYIFVNDDEVEQDGGKSPLVVTKEDGECLNYAYCLATGMLSTDIASGLISEV